MYIKIGMSWWMAITSFSIPNLGLSFAMSKNLFNNKNKIIRYSRKTVSKGQLILYAHLSNKYALTATKYDQA